MESNCSLVIKKLTDIYQHLPQVKIDLASRFKYIYIAIYFKSSKNTKFVYSAKDDTIYFVRGTKKHNYHAEIYEEFVQELNKLKLNVEVLVENEEKQVKTLKGFIKIDVYGGGWMEWNDKKLNIFGQSQAYGPANHERTKELILKNNDEFKVKEIILTDDL